MKISISVLYENMTRWKPKLLGHSGRDTMVYSGLYCITDRLTEIPGKILFGEPASFPRDLKDKAIISFGRLPEELAVHNTLLIFPGDSDRSAIYQEIELLFTRYEEWDESLHRALVERKSIQHMLELSTVILENPIYVHDRNFALLGSVNMHKDQNGWEYDQRNQQYILSLEIMNDYKLDEEYQATMSIDGPDIFSDTIFGYRILYRNLRTEGAWYGRLCVNELKRKFRKSDFALLSHLSDMLLMSLEMGHAHVSPNTRELENAFLKLIASGSLEKTPLFNTLVQYGWDTEDEFFCAVLQTEYRDVRTNAIAYTCRKLYDMFPYSCIFSYHDKIVLVVNTSRGHLTIHEFASQLAVFLREGLFRAGISSVGRDFSHLGDYYKQALEVYDLGSQKDPSFWQYCFDDYVLPYIFRQSIRELPAPLLCRKELFLLQKYDEEHRTDFFKTLKVYLEQNMNISHTSEALIIHRSTLLYRLERIQTLTGMNLNTPKLRFSLLYSYYLMEDQEM